MAEVTYWRVGSKVHRTLYRGDERVGQVDTEEIALEVIHALNARGRSLLEVAADSIRHFAERLDADDEEQAHIAHGMRQAVEIMRGIAERENGGPRDAQRRSEATPQKDLESIPLLPDFAALDPSRVDPYDTKKGFTP